MEQIKRRTKGITAISIIIFIFGLLMVGYWTSYIWQGMPLKGIPLGSELVAAVLAIITAVGLFRMRPWSLATALILCGLWIYGVVGGINLVIENGLDFESPVGALTDTIIFVVVLICSVFIAIFLWRRYPVLLDIRER